MRTDLSQRKYRRHAVSSASNTTTFNQYHHLQVQGHRCGTSTDFSEIESHESRQSTARRTPTTPRNVTAKDAEYLIEMVGLVRYKVSLSGCLKYLKDTVDDLSWEIEGLREKNKHQQINIYRLQAELRKMQRGKSSSKAKEKKLKASNARLRRENMQLRNRQQSLYQNGPAVCACSLIMNWARCPHCMPAPHGATQNLQRGFSHQSKGSNTSSSIHILFPNHGEVEEQGYVEQQRPKNQARTRASSENHYNQRKSNLKQQKQTRNTHKKTVRYLDSEGGPQESTLSPRQDQRARDMTNNSCTWNIIPPAERAEGDKRELKVKKVTSVSVNEEQQLEEEDFQMASLAMQSSTVTPTWRKSKMMEQSPSVVKPDCNQGLSCLNLQGMEHSRAQLAAKHAKRKGENSTIQEMPNESGYSSKNGSVRMPSQLQAFSRKEQNPYPSLDSEIAEESNEGEITRVNIETLPDESEGSPLPKVNNSTLSPHDDFGDIGVSSMMHSRINPEVPEQDGLFEGVKEVDMMRSNIRGSKKVERGGGLMQEFAEVEVLGEMNFLKSQIKKIK